MCSAISSHLNQAAFEGTYEITALSFHAYAHLADRYQLMPSGASFGDGYGPVVVSTAPPVSRRSGGQECGDSRRVDDRSPGAATVATGRLDNQRPLRQDLRHGGCGEVDAGVVIHEGQLTYGDIGLHKVEDLGE